MDRQLGDSCRDACLSLESCGFVSKGDLPVGNIAIVIASGDIVIDEERAHSAKMQITCDGNGVFRPCNTRLTQRQKPLGKRLTNV